MTSIAWKAVLGSLFDKQKVIMQLTDLLRNGSFQ